MSQEQQPMITDKPSEKPGEKPSTETKKSRFPVIKIKMKTLIIALVVLLILGAAYYFKGLYIAAWVDGRPISRISIIKELEKQSGQTALDTKVNERLIEDEVKARKITISDDDVNNRIKTIEDQIKSQGSTLDAELTNAGLTMDELKDQIKTQLKLEKLVGDKAQVSDQEVTDYITANKITLPAGQEDATKAQIKDQIKQQKLGNESQTLLTDLKAKAKIKYFVTY